MCEQPANVSYFASLAGVALFTEAVSGLILPLFALAVVALVLFGLFLYEVDVYGNRKSETRKAGPLARGIATYGRFGAEIALDLNKAIIDRDAGLGCDEVRTPAKIGRDHRPFEPHRLGHVEPKAFGAVR